MILWQLFLSFLQVGAFSFGGAYGAIPLIRDVVSARGWLDDEALTHMIAVSESTPGPIMVNMATYVGNSQAGLPGAAVATLLLTTAVCEIPLLAGAFGFTPISLEEYVIAIAIGVLGFFVVEIVKFFQRKHMAAKTL